MSTMWAPYVPNTHASPMRSSICLTGSTTRSRRIPTLEFSVCSKHAGAVLAVHGAGAYGFAMSSNYNSRPRAAEVLVDADRWIVRRDRETMTDLVRGERSLEEISDADWRGASGGAV